MVLRTIYEVFGVVISPKCFAKEGNIPIGPEVVAAGFLIGRNNQIYCNEMLEVSLQVLLTKPVKGEKQLMSLIGSLVQSHAGFKFDTDQI